MISDERLVFAHQRVILIYMSLCLDHHVCVKSSKLLHSTITISDLSIGKQTTKNECKKDLFRHRLRGGYHLSIFTNAVACKQWI